MNFGFNHFDAIHFQQVVKAVDILIEVSLDILVPNKPIPYVVNARKWRESQIITFVLRALLPEVSIMYCLHNRSNCVGYDD